MNCSLATATATTAFTWNDTRTGYTVGAGWESELFREGFVADLRGRFEKRARKKDEEKDQEVVSIHWLAFRIPRAPLV